MTVGDQVVLSGVPGGTRYVVLALSGPFAVVCGLSLHGRVTVYPRDKIQVYVPPRPKPTPGQYYQHRRTKVLGVATLDGDIVTPAYTTDTAFLVHSAYVEEEWKRVDVKEAEDDE